LKNVLPISYYHYFLFYQPSVLPLFLFSSTIFIVFDLIHTGDKKMTNHPKHECAGRFNPVYDNLVLINESFYKTMREAREKGLPAEMYAELEKVGEMAGNLGQRFKEAFGDASQCSEKET